MWYQSGENRRIREEALQELERRREAGEVYEVLEAPARGHLAKTGWGRAWCRYVEGFAAWGGRTCPGRSLLRKGQVFNARIFPGRIEAEVLDDGLYRVVLEVAELGAEEQERLQADLAGSAMGLLDLAKGEVPDTLLDRLGEHGLFPGVGGLKCRCGCEDWADICRHSAAVFYGAAIMLERDPLQLFYLRGTSPGELLGQGLAALPEGPVAGEGEHPDLEVLFGIKIV